MRSKSSEHLRGRLTIKSVNMDDRVKRLIDVGLERMNISKVTQSYVVLDLLGRIKYQESSMEKVASVLHILSLFVNAADPKLLEFYETVTKCEPQAPNTVQACIEWYPEFAHRQRQLSDTITGMSKRLTGIQAAIRGMAAKVGEVCDVKEGRDESIDGLKKEIMDLKDKLTKHESEARTISVGTSTEDESVTSLLKREITRLEEGQKECHISVARAEAIVEGYRKREEEFKFDINAMKEKCLIMRNDLDHATRRRRILEASSAELQAVLNRKQSECDMLRSKV